MEGQFTVWNSVCWNQDIQNLSDEVGAVKLQGISDLHLETCKIHLVSNEEICAEAGDKSLWKDLLKIWILNIKGP